MFSLRGGRCEPGPRRRRAAQRHSSIQRLARSTRRPGHHGVGGPVPCWDPWRAISGRLARVTRGQQGSPVITASRRSAPIASENRTIPKLVVRVRFPSPAHCAGPGGDPRSPRCEGCLRPHAGCCRGFASPDAPAISGAGICRVSLYLYQGGDAPRRRRPPAPARPTGVGAGPSGRADRAAVVRRIASRDLTAFRQFPTVTGCHPSPAAPSFCLRRGPQTPGWPAEGRAGWVAGVEAWSSRPPSPQGKPSRPGPRGTRSFVRWGAPPCTPGAWPAPPRVGRRRTG